MLSERRITFKGRTIFIVGLIATGLTFLIVYLTGIDFNRSLTSNLYISLSIISATVFIFLAFGMYKGIGVIDNPPKLEGYEPGSILHGRSFPDFPDTGDGLGGIIFGILLWIVLAILIVIGLLLLEAFFWLSLFVIFSMLYWVFIRAVRLILFRSRKTKGDLMASVLSALSYTAICTGWLFAIAVVLDLYR